jgi:hypothetical protein
MTASPRTPCHGNDSEPQGLTIHHEYMGSPTAWPSMGVTRWRVVLLSLPEEVDVDLRPNEKMVNERSFFDMHGYGVIDKSF